MKAFIIHKFPYQDADFIIKLLSCEGGLISVIAKGAKRSKKGIAGLLQPFLSVDVEYYGKSELKKLKSVEMAGGAIKLAGIRLYSAFYLNELILFLCPIGVPQENIFSYYGSALSSLADMDKTVEITLRQFEWSFLNELGIAPNLTIDQNNQKIKPDAFYQIQVESLPVKVSSDQKHAFLGKDLLGISVQKFTEPAVLKASKRLFRYWISHYCNGKTFKSRQMASLMV